MDQAKDKGDQPGAFFGQGQLAGRLTHNLDGKKQNAQ
jgi:hypothetical protein